MELGALVVTGGNGEQEVGGRAIWSSTWPVLGKTVLERWLDRVQHLGASMVSVARSDAQPASALETMCTWANQGIERILLILLGSYAEVDLLDVVHFHHWTQNRVTRVFDPEGPLGISLYDRVEVLRHRHGDGGSRSLSAARYDFRGYVTRLSSTQSYRQLVLDALKGNCGIRPEGQQNDAGIWVDPTAKVHSTVKFQAPCFVGPNVRLRAGVELKRYSSVEEGCEIDIGTTIDQSSILPYTYIAPGLNVRHAVVDGTRLEHLDRGLTVDLSRAGLASARTESFSDPPRFVRDDESGFAGTDFNRTDHGRETNTGE